MKSHNPDNERIKRRYFAYLKDAKRQSDASIDAAAAALHRFECYTGFRGFNAFHIQQASAFKQHLSERVKGASGEPLSKSTLYSTLNALKAFFLWLAGQPGYRSRIRYSDADYFHLSAKDTAIAKARRDAPVPTLEQVLHVIAVMPSSTDIERRNRALLAFTLLTGARDGAIVSLKLKHVDLIEGCLVQDAREVRTKFAKSFTTYFMPVDKGVRKIVEEWVDFLSTVKLWGNDDPLFPATLVGLDSDLRFSNAGLDRRHWTNAGPIRTIFKEAFEAAGMPYFNPHSFRKTLAQLGEAKCRTPEEFKAWSQNLGHEGVLTTFSSYGEVSRSRQADIIRALAAPAKTQTGALDQILKIIHDAR